MFVIFNVLESSEMRSRLRNHTEPSVILWPIFFKTRFNVADW